MHCEEETRIMLEYLNKINADEALYSNVYESQATEAEIVTGKWISQMCLRDLLRAKPGPEKAAQTRGSALWL